MIAWKADCGWVTEDMSKFAHISPFAITNLLITALTAGKYLGILPWKLAPRLGLYPTGQEPISSSVRKMCPQLDASIDRNVLHGGARLTRRTARQVERPLLILFGQAKREFTPDF